MFQLQQLSRCLKWSASVAGEANRRRCLPNLDRSVLDSGLEQLSRVRYAHLFHHVGPMGLDGLDADLESLADFLVFEPGPNQFKNLFLAAGKRAASYGVEGSDWLGKA